MQPSELLNEFVSFGGIADNIEIRNGAFGLGLFVIDPAQETRIAVPSKLLVPADWVELDEENNIRLGKASTLGGKQKHFFERYQRALSWGGARDAIFARQQQISALPERVKALLTKIGWTDNDLASPTPSGCLHKFKQSRRLSYQGKLVIMPMLELANHDAACPSFVVNRRGVEIHGNFPEQVLVNYATGLDPVGMFRTYGFSELTQQVMSCPMEMGNPAFGKIIISRAPREAIMSGGAKIPKIRREGREFHLSYLPVGDMSDPGMPREIFGRLMLEIGLPPQVAELLFNRIVAENRMLYQTLLAELQPMQGDLCSDLRKMLQHQLHPIA